jgi:hypothetical protein
MAINVESRSMMTVADTSMLNLTAWHFMWGGLTSDVEGTLITCGNAVTITHTDSVLTFTNYGTTTDGIWTWDISSEYSTDINEVIIVHWTGQDEGYPILWINGVAKGGGTQTQTPSGARQMATSATWYIGGTSTNAARIKGNMIEADVVPWNFTTIPVNSTAFARITANHILGQFRRSRGYEATYDSTPSKHWNFAGIANDNETAYATTDYSGDEEENNHVGSDANTEWSKVVGSYSTRYEALRSGSDADYMAAKRTSGHNDSGNIQINAINQNIISEIPTGGWMTRLRTSYRRRSPDGKSFNSKWRLGGKFDGKDYLSSNTSATTWIQTNANVAISNGRSASIWLLSTANSSLAKGEENQVSYAKLQIDWTRKPIRSSGAGREILGASDHSITEIGNGARPKLARAL